MGRPAGKRVEHGLSIRPRWGGAACVPAGLITPSVLDPCGGAIPCRFRSVKRPADSPAFPTDPIDQTWNTEKQPWSLLRQPRPALNGLSPGIAPVDQVRDLFAQQKSPSDQRGPRVGPPSQVLHRRPDRRTGPDPPDIVLPARPRSRCKVRGLALFHDLRNAAPVQAPEIVRKYGPWRSRPRGEQGIWGIEDARHRGGKEGGRLLRGFQIRPTAEPWGSFPLLPTASLFHGDISPCGVRTSHAAQPPLNKTDLTTPRECGNRLPADTTIYRARQAQAAAMVLESGPSSARPCTPGERNHL